MSLPTTGYLEVKRSFWTTLTSEKYFKWTLLIPLLLILAIFMFYPMFYCLYYSAHDYTVVKPAEFVGWGMYRMVLRDPVFWKAMRVTFEILAVCIATELIIGMGVALWFNREFRGQNVVRGLCLLPLLVSPFAISLFWTFMFHADFGIANQVLMWLGFSGGTDWFGKELALYSIMLMTIWQWSPFAIFVLLAGLRSLPRDSFEAARVDGASSWYTFRRLTLPMLTPLILIIVLLRVMWLIRIFDPVYGTTRGAVGTETLDLMVNRIAFLFFDVGQGSALAMISLFLTIILCAIMFRVLMKALGVLK